MKVAVLGVGLIGGSIGLDARLRMGAHVVGYDTDETVLPRAIELGAIDEHAYDIASAVQGADVVFAAVPVGALLDVLNEALRVAGPNTVISDVGSTKREVFRALDDERFVGGHPLAGAEVAGVEYARRDLFEGAVWYLTTRAESNGDATERLIGIVEQLGARPIAIDASVHDRLMARVSHLPHVLANVLVAEAEGVLLGDGGVPLGDGMSSATAIGVASGVRNATDVIDQGMNGATRVAGPSFRDATRVAGANTAIWTDIYLSNRDALGEAIDETIKRLELVRGALANGDAAALAKWNEHARAEHEKLKQAGSTPDL